MAPKRINKKTVTKVAVNSTSSPFSGFPRIVGPGGVTTPPPASALTIPQVFQDQHQQQALVAHTAEWHAETRQKLVTAIATFPGTSSYSATVTTSHNVRVAHRPGGTLKSVLDGRRHSYRSTHYIPH